MNFESIYFLSLQIWNDKSYTMENKNCNFQWIAVSTCNTKPNLNPKVKGTTAIFLIQKLCILLQILMKFRKNISLKRRVAEFKEFEPRFKFKPRLNYGWFHLKLYQMFQDLSRRSI